MNKIIWIVTIVGLLPVGVLSLLTIMHQQELADLRNSLPDPNSWIVMGQSYSMGVGPAHIRLVLSNRKWPAFAALLGIALVISALFFLLPKDPRHVYKSGFSKIEHYVSRLLNSKNSYASVIIGAVDGGHSILVTRQDDKVSLGIILDMGSGGASAAKSKILDFFSTFGISPNGETIGTNGVGDAKNTCILEFDLQKKPDLIAIICRDLFVKVFGENDASPMEFITTGC